jgi:branched-chain amino acid transport system ATP-binding protein
MLTVKDVRAGYGDAIVLNGVSIEIKEGETISVLGGNGVGKTTLVRVISGLMKPVSGTVEFQGEDISGLPAYEVAARGLALVPEARRIFSGLTVRENLEMGAYLHRKNVAQVAADLEVVFGAFPRLKERNAQLGGTLSGGEQQMLAIGRGLMSRPQLMMVDEPSLGLAPIMVAEVFRVLREGLDWKPTLLIVEQNAILALNNSERAYVLQDGLVQLSGPSSDLLKAEELSASYLGQGH